MNILWFTNTPCVALDKLTKSVSSGGWLYALSQKMSNVQNVNLSIAFYWHDNIQPFEYKNIRFFPIYRTGTASKLERFLYRIKKSFSNRINENEIIKCVDIVNKVQPELIHIHGTEENFGLLCTKNLDIPIVISIQGFLSSIYIKLFSGYPKSLINRHESITHKILFNGIENTERNFIRNVKREQLILQNCKNIIGRTTWDANCTLSVNPKRRYFSCNEIMRNEFYETIWKRPQNNDTIHIVTTISSGIYKGVETLYRTAYQLTQIGYKFNWHVIGLNNDDSIVKLTEKILKYKSEGINITFHGKKTANEMLSIMNISHIYIQVSHIENSPNSLCEAMLLGMPIIASMAGGTSSMIKDGIEGIVIQDGDPYNLCGAIISCINNYQTAINMGTKARETAQGRHNREKITKDLTNIYKEIISDNE